MSDIVIGLASSHGPSIQSPPETWAKLAEKDTRDPRLDYRALLAAARSGLEAEIGIEVQRRRHAALQTALRALGRRLSEASPDVVVVISNAHVVRHAEPRPAFAILRAPEFAAVESSAATFETAALAAQSSATSMMPGHPALADHLISGLIELGFDIGCIDQLRDGAVIDEAFAFCYKWLLSGAVIPMVPLYLSRDLPGQATPGRCLDLGRALRKCIQSCPLQLRVGVVASGGLSHQVVDEELDRKVLALLETGRLDELRTVSRERLNRAPGTPEILNWIALGGAMAPVRMELLSYEPCYRSPAGTGHGAAVSQWSIM
jgi:aromatic ring-opening dioxygenase catalytic subunit (LigB family)